jgi:hypothetical protein
MKLVIAAIVLFFGVVGSAEAQYHGGGYGRGLGPSCGYYGCYVQYRYAYQGYRPAPRYRYDWSWGGGNRGYLGGRGGGWGGEW